MYFIFSTKNNHQHVSIGFFFNDQVVHKYDNPFANAEKTNTNRLQIKCLIMCHIRITVSNIPIYFFRIIARHGRKRQQQKRRGTQARSVASVKDRSHRRGTGTRRCRTGRHVLDKLWHDIGATTQDQLQVLDEQSYANSTSVLNKFLK